jgi:hypothetical protein
MTPVNDRSPFPYQGPLAPEQVSGRDDLIADLAQRLIDHRLTALLGPRRFGKTSLLRRVTSDLEAVGPDTIWIDLYELNSMADLAVAVDRALQAVTGRLRKVLSAVAAGLTVQLGVVGIELSRAARDRPDPVIALRSLLQVLVRTAEKHPLIVVFDEFSGIANVDGAAGLLRTELQHHYQQIGIVFAGSQPSTMRTLFGHQAQPFFAQADLVEIGPLDDVAVRDIVERGFEATGRRAGVVSEQVVRFSRGHPQRAMQMADAAWRLTPPDGEADEEMWAGALEAVRTSVDSGSERLYELIPTGQQKTLRAIVSGGSIYGAVADVLELSPGTAKGAVDALLGNGYLSRRNDKLVVVDPLFADWIRRRFAP